VPLATYRQWPDGAWATVTGRVTVPGGLFSTRLVYIQDESGAGLAVYLGRGSWPRLVLGQSVTVLGYLRHTDTGQLQIYVRNRWWTRFGPEEEAVPVTPLAFATGQIGEANESALVTVAGRIVRLESQASWIDDGSGLVRVFFSSATGLRRPKVQRGEWWTITGIVIENTTVRDRTPRFYVQPRFASDVARLTDASGQPLPTSTPIATEIPTMPTGVPTDAPAETPEP
jgi:hypothetical protein